MKRTCEGCGKAVTGRPDKRYCSEVCSKRVRRGAAGPLTETDVTPDETPVSDRVRAELEAVERLDTWQGVAALAVAARIDGSTAVMGAAALFKELRLSMAEAMEGVKVAADPVDELRRRRDQKYAG